MDNIYEQFIYSKSDGTAQIKFFSFAISAIVLLILAAVSLVIAFQQSMWALLAATAVTGVAGVFAWLKKDNAYIEYEYSYTLGDLEVAKIINNKRRRILCKFDCKDIEAFGKISTSAYQRYANNPNIKKVYATFLKLAERDVYYMFYVGKKAKYLIHFEPDDEMLTYIKKHLRVVIDVK